MDLLICGAVIALVSFVTGAGTVGITLILHNRLTCNQKELTFDNGREEG